MLRNNPYSVYNSIYNAPLDMFHSVVGGGDCVRIYTSRQPERIDWCAFLFMPCEEVQCTYNLNLKIDETLFGLFNIFVK